MFKEKIACAKFVGEAAGFCLANNKSLTEFERNYIRKYSDLRRRLKAFETKYKKIKSLIGFEKSVKDYFFSDDKLKELWLCHEKDLSLCEKIYKIYLKSGCINGIDFGDKFIYEVLIPRLPRLEEKENGKIS